MTSSDIAKRVALLRMNGVQPQDDGRYPFVLTTAEWESLSADLREAGMPAVDAPPAELLTATKSYASDVLRARFFVSSYLGDVP